MSESVLPFAVPPVVKTVTVRCSPEKAFRLFTADIARWWPLQGFHVGADPATCVLEERAGGRVYERAINGTESDWGIVEVWEPPHRLVFTWRIEVPQGQRIDVRFALVPEGTRVELTHSGWEHLGDRAAARREQYDGGWVAVFEKAFASYANAA